MADTDVREYAAQAASTDTFGRVLCSARDHHFVVDGPVQNGWRRTGAGAGQITGGSVARHRGGYQRHHGPLPPGTPGCLPVQLRAPEFPRERRHRTARPATGRGLQGQVTALRHGRSCDPECTDRTRH